MSKTITIRPNGDWEFDGIGVLRPEPDITPLESLTLSTILTTASFWASNSHPLNQFEALWDRINDEPGLRRHFKQESVQ